ncbi:MAG: zinc ribbon domain-containing protein [Rhodothermales bacterium]
MVTAQETSIGEQLRALIRLQHVDSRIDQVKKLRGDLPEEIRDLEDEKVGLETRIENIKHEQKEVAQGRLQAERDIKEAEQLIKKYDDQQMQVRNNREYDALTKEIEAQKQRIADATKTIEETEGSADQQAAAITDTEERLAELDALLATKRAELKEVLGETQQEQSDLETTRQEAANLVDKRYLRAYDRLRERLRDGRAVVKLERGAASGFAVPPQRQVEIRQRNRIVACEHTGRIIVDHELYDETVKEFEN